MNIKIIGFDKGPFDFNPEMLESWDDKHPVNLAVSGAFKYKKDADLIGFQIDFRGEMGNIVVIRCGFVVLFKADGWTDLIAVGEDPQTNREILYPFCEKILDFSAGVIASRTADSDYGKAMMLPDLKPEQIAEDIKVKCL